MSSIASIIAIIAQSLGALRTVTREAIAASLEDIASKVRAGALIPDEAIAQAQRDQDRLDRIYANLKGDPED
jgi:hypothetical protein